jgi:hypothetical protein
VTLQFFLYEILARIVALYLCFDCTRRLRSGLAERKIEFITPDFLDAADWLLNKPNWVVHRDTTPIRYWMLMGSQMTALAACVFVVIFGWWHPNT